MLDVYQPFNGLGICSNVLKLSVQKKVSAVKTVLAMPLKQNCSHLNSSSYPCKKKKQYLLLACSNGWSYLFKEKF